MYLRYCVRFLLRNNWVKKFGAIFCGVCLFVWIFGIWNLEFGVFGFHYKTISYYYICCLIRYKTR